MIAVGIECGEDRVAMLTGEPESIVMPGHGLRRVALRRCQDTRAVERLGASDRVVAGCG